ncbi:general control non-repressible 5 [Actinidia rufa]|uniref:General control non-repressible 5 n=1 Tax=Actinidia rufa TaxID=165716 RepID=A0A7J0E1R1_9ERIC|nr:general control non-repressible 5 [Actinidia rufa]
MEIAAKLQFIDLRSTFLTGLALNLRPRLLPISHPITHLLITDVSWEVKKGEKVGLVGVNGAGKTTQMIIITGQEQADLGNVIKAKHNMKISFLSQEVGVSLSRTVKEELMSAFKEGMEIATRLEKRQEQAVDLDEVDMKISKLMLELGFAPEDSDRLVATFSGGWQMRMCRSGRIYFRLPSWFRLALRVSRRSTLEGARLGDALCLLDATYSPLLRLSRLTWVYVTFCFHLPEVEVRSFSLVLGRSSFYRLYRLHQSVINQDMCHFGQLGLQALDGYVPTVSSLREQPTWFLAKRWPRHQPVA